MHGSFLYPSPVSTRPTQLFTTRHTLKSFCTPPLSSAIPLSKRYPKRCGLAGSQIINYPDLTLKMLKANKPHSPATELGHIPASRANVRSNRTLPRPKRTSTSIYIPEPAFLTQPAPTTTNDDFTSPSLHCAHKRDHHSVPPHHSLPVKGIERESKMR
jgi:hypothetical protein